MLLDLSSSFRTHSFHTINSKIVGKLESKLPSLRV